VSPEKRLTRGERAVLEAHRTPWAAQRWIRSLSYNFEQSGPTLRSFRGVVRYRTAHCLEAALAAATLMELHGLPPLILDMESQDCLDHVVFAFQHNGRWGAVGGSRDVGLWGRRPVFRSVRSLAMSYYEPYIDLGARIETYALVNLRELAPYDWRFSDRNVWKVERHLIELPHTPLETSDTRYIRLRERYRRYLQNHSPHDTPFKQGKQHWM
jgi:hypothetical protein